MPYYYTFSNGPREQSNCIPSMECYATGDWIIPIIIILFPTLLFGILILADYLGKKK